MAKKKSQAKKKPAAPVDETNDTEGVGRLIAELAHPLTQLIEDIREAVLKADAAITEGVKWNSPSFYCCGWFATIHARRPDRLELVLHHGARSRQDTVLSETISDPDELLRWAAKDRAIMTITEDADFSQFRGSLKKIIRQWVDYQRQLAKTDQAWRKPGKSVIQEQ